MLEPLSEPIRKLLLELKLCSLHDLTRCRRQVSRLTFDLPAFDSVWLDALVQIGRLTPFQARILESSTPEKIRIGPYVAVNRLGSGPRGQTLLARPADAHELCVIKHIESSDCLSEEVAERLQSLVKQARELSHPSIVCPVSCVRSDHRLVLISRYIPGPHLGELVVRRGRFPAAVVWEIGRQLAEGLAGLAQRGIAHGDIRPASVRLTAGGIAVLVDAGVGPAMTPVLTIHSGLSPDRYDGIAPELIGVNGQPSQATDAYALGCLLWQLLAGRPPFPAGDPLVKLSAHQTRSIDDVRKWAPDTPDLLAKAIFHLTARNPEERLKSFSKLLDVWGYPLRSGRRRLAAFRKRFDSPARLKSERRRLSAPTRWLFLLATLFALSGAALTLSDQGARSVVLAWVSPSAPETSRESPSTESAARDDAELPGDAEPSTSSSKPEIGSPLPAPDPQGVIHLTGEGPYRVSDITTVGELAIVGQEGFQPQIVIEDRPLKLCAEKVRLKNVRICTVKGSAERRRKLKTLVRVQSQELTVEDCTFESGEIGSADTVDPAKPVVAPASGPAAIAWKLLDATEQRGGMAIIRNSVLLGDGPGLYLAQAVRQVEFDNVLKIGPSPLVHLAAIPGAKAATTLRLTHTTCRSSGALLRWIVPVETAPRGRILVEAADCVFDLLSPQAALFELAGPDVRPDWLRKINMTGEGSVAGAGLEIAAWISIESGRLYPLEAALVELEGIFAGELSFAGDPGPEPDDSEVRDVEAPRRSNAPPGIRAAALSRR